MRRRLAILAATVALTALARVYDLQPGIGARDVREVLRAKEVLSQEIEVNGETGRLEVHYTQLEHFELLRSLGRLLKNYEGAAQGGSILIEAPRRDGWLTRFYIVSTGKDRKGLIFSIDIPKRAREVPARDFWPREAPLPAAAEVSEVVRLNDQGIIWASYTVGGNAEAATRAYLAQLEGHGDWREVSSDPTGAVYFSRDGKRILVFSAMDGRQGARAAVFIRPNQSEN